MEAIQSLKDSFSAVQGVQRKKFILDLVESYKLEREDVEGRRHYLVPYGDSEMRSYPSVTTVINEFYDKSYLKQWKKRVGHKESIFIAGAAATKGNNIHNMAELYLYGKEYWRDQIKLNVLEFNKIVPILNDHITKVYGAELKLFSHILETAGTCDLACEWDNVPAIVDFKTSRQEKKEKDIQNYFAQCATYAYMFEELYGLKIEKFVIIMLVEWDSNPTLFEGNPQEYRDLVEEIFAKQ